jgi:hypothetical protein
VAEVMAAEGYKVQPPPRIQRHDIIQVFLSLLIIIWSVGLVFSHIKTDKKGVFVAQSINSQKLYFASIWTGSATWHPRASSGILCSSAKVLSCWSLY